jgi:dihydroxyacetone kinase-like protein
MVHAVHKVLDGAGVKVVRYLTGSYVTLLEMAGCSVTVSAVDATALALWDAPVHAAALRWGM